MDYESINVHGNRAAMEELHKLGARSVPIVSRGERFVYAQTLSDVIKFLDLQIKLHEPLSPEELLQKLDLVLTAAARYVRQIPDDRLDLPFRNRNRSIRALGCHVFRIPEAFLEVVPAGPLSYERIMAEPVAQLHSGDDIARYGEGVLEHFKQWWAGYADKRCSSKMDTYFGMHPLHEVLERTVWHPTQHTRQLMLILDDLGIEPNRRLGSADFAGLPLPEKAWDAE